MEHNDEYCELFNLSCGGAVIAGYTDMRMYPEFEWGNTMAVTFTLFWNGLAHELTRSEAKLMEKYIIGRSERRSFWHCMKTAGYVPANPRNPELYEHVA